MFTLTQFMLLATMLLVALIAGAALTHERVARWFWATVEKRAWRIGWWAFGVQDAVWESVHTSEWTPGRLGSQWLRFVNWLDAKCADAARIAGVHLADLDDDGSFVEAD